MEEEYSEEEDYREEDHERAVAEILEEETAESATLRLSNHFKITDELVFSQERDIETCFRDVNYLRAELAELCGDKSKSLLEKNYLVRFAAASYKELSARQHYTTLTMNAALDRAKTRSAKSENNWKLRIHNDQRVKLEYKTILKDKNLTFKLRKKYEWEYNRAKSVLLADIAAYKEAWPDGDHESGIDFSVNAGTAKVSDVAPSTTRATVSVGMSQERA